MEMHTRKKIEIVVEAPLLNRLLGILDDANVPGYTVLPAIAGRGHHGSWSREGLATDAGRMVVVMLILSPDAVPGLMATIHPLIVRQIAIVSVSDVQVIRGERF
jgi:PII-like signaling protein